MKLEKQKEALVLRDEPSDDSIGMSLDLDSAQFLMQMLSKTLYSDGIGSAIRETASNALDSHRKAGVDEPIIVSLKPSDSGEYEFSVEDFGIGLDREDVWEIISKYGKSTKRESDEELGLFGLGFKSPLAYTSSFYFVARKDGTERKYMMYEGEDVNTIDLLYEQETDKRNGTKVIMPVKYSDRHSFYKKIREQLAYFEDVYFDVEVSGQYSWSSNDSLSNDFSILRHELFQKSEIANDSKMHICLDNVYYPIDYDKLGINSIPVPIGLRFNLTDGIYPTPNRESIRYTQEAKEIILQKIADVSAHLIGEFNNKLATDGDVISAINYYRSNERHLYIAGTVYDIIQLEEHSNVKFKNPMEDKFKLIDVRDIIENNYNNLLYEYLIKFEISNDRFTGVRKDPNSYIGKFNNYEFYNFEGTIRKNMKEYMKYIARNSSRKFKFVQKVRKRKLKSSGWENTSYVKILDLATYPKSEWRERIKEFQYFESLIITKFKNLSDVVIDKDWLESTRKRRIANSYSYTGKGKKLKGEISVKEAQRLERFVEGQNCKMVPERYNVEGIHKRPYLIIYSEHDDRQKLDALFRFIKNHNIKLISLSQREINNISKFEVHNLISYDEFMKGNTKTFKRIVTGFLVRKLVSDNSRTFNYIEYISKVSEDLGDKLRKIDKYDKDNRNHADDTVHDAMLEVAEANNLFDPDIYIEYLELKRILKDLYFIEPVIEAMSRYTYNNDKLGEMIRILADLFKYHKYKVNLEHYKQKEEEKEEEVVVEDSNN